MNKEKKQAWEIPDDLLCAICGGTREEIDELRQFIEEHDKTWTYRNAGDIGSWLMMNADLTVAELMFQEDNAYQGGKGSISHAQLMAKLKKQFS